MKKLTIAVILALLISVCCAVAKDKKHDEGATPDEVALKLTSDEGKDALILQQNSQILELQIEKLQTQVTQARQKASNDLREFTEKTARAHGLDPDKYRLDINAKAFVAKEPAPEKK